MSIQLTHGMHCRWMWLWYWWTFQVVSKRWYFFFAFDLLHRNDWVARLLVSFQLVLFPVLCERSVVMSLTCLSIRPSISAVLTGTLCMGDQASFYNVATSWLMRLIAYFVYQHFDTSVHQRPQGVSTYQCLLRLQTYFVPVGLSPESK